ncbi:MAG: Acyl carrier protein [Bryobacterales bacterium]|jgi:acyl carrier protein|nr:Acyl carrier protein [Bryobacterales bacterium]
MRRVFQSYDKVFNMFDEDVIRFAAREVVANMVSSAITDGEPLISSGLIDSLSILKLIAKLEKKLGINIPTDNLQPDDFESVDFIVETVQRVATAS